MEYIQSIFVFIFISISKILYKWNSAIFFVIASFLAIFSLIYGSIKIPQKKYLKPALLILLTIIATILGVWVDYVKANYTFVPEIDFGNQSLQEVHSELDRASLQFVDNFDEEAQKHKDKGEDPTSYFFKVLGCDPESGEFVEKEIDVNLHISWIDKPKKRDKNENKKDFKKKPDTIIKKSTFDIRKKLWKVPNVKELTQETAEKILGTLKISYRISGEGYSDTIEAGSVLSQEPEAGTDIEANTEVILVISKGVESIQMPNVVGMSRKKAKNKLEKLGLKVIEEQEYDAAEPEGDVIRQSVNAEESVSKGMEIKIVISKGTKPEEDKPKPTPTETPVPPSPKPTATPAPTETPAPPSPPPTATPAPTETPPPVPTEPVNDSGTIIDIPEGELN